MAGECIPGRVSRLLGSFDNGTTFINIDGIVDATLNVNVDELECTTHDDDGARRFIPNHHDETMDTTLRWDELSAGQLGILLTIFPTPTTFKVQFFMQVLASRRRFDADAFVTSYAASGPLDDSAGLDVTLRLSGTTPVIQ